MNIEKLSVNLRPRNRWEAVDLGFAMARQWFWQLWALWMLVALPMAVLLMAGALHVLELSAGWSLMLVWWFKPLYEQPLLFYLSRVLFGERLSIRQVFRQYWQVVRPQLLPILTYRRFSFSRSFDNPVAMLEQLKGTARGQRLRLLHRRQGSVAMWLTVLYVHVEVILQLSAMALLALLLPPEQELLGWRELLFSDGGWLEWLNLLTYLLAASSLAPFYVAAGFVMYINRRAELEAWDIELQFKRLRQRVQERDRDRVRQSRAQQSPPTAPSPLQKNGVADSGKTKTKTSHVAGVVLALALGMLGWATPQNSQAQPSRPVQQLAQTETAPPKAVQSGTTGEKARAKKQIEDILAGDAFGKNETQTNWKYKKEETEVGDEEEETSWFGEWLEKLLKKLFGDDDGDGEGDDGGEGRSSVNLIAGLLEVLLWSLLVVVVAYVLFRAGKWASAMGWVKLPSGTPEKELPPTELFGLQVSAESLPDDVPAQALQLLEKGEWRACLALLYRASLVRLIHRHGLEIRSSFTEQECDRLVRLQRPDGQADYFSRLTQLWLLLAYGHRQLQVEQVRNLCGEWGVHFATAQTDADSVDTGAGA